MNDVPVMQLTGRAAHFVGLLREFGHLDEETIHGVVIQASEFVAEAGGDKVDIDVIRRICALTLFGIHGGVSEGVLVQDWPMLFS